MKRIFSKIARLTPRTKLALSALLLFAALFFFWVGANRPLPTAGLAFRLAAAQSAYAPGDMVVLDDADLPLTHDIFEGTPPQRRYLSLEGDRLYYGVVTRFHPLSWTGRAGGLWLYPLKEGPFSRPIPLNIYTDSYWESAGNTAGESLSGHEGWYALACKEPTVTRVEAAVTGQYILSEEQSDGSYQSRPLEPVMVRTVECAEAEPGSGIWLCRVDLLFPEVIHGGNSLSVDFTLVGYDASGQEVCRSSTD